ncbi:MAG TPA: hypothetical protein ENI23_10910 [bacterium]|nr:hypothetical protein [bacterium]
MKRSEANYVYKLLRQWTRAEIMARLGRFDNLEFADYFVKKIEIEDKLRKFMFGTSNLVELGIKWGLIKEKRTRRKKKQK